MGSQAQSAKAIYTFSGGIDGNEPTTLIQAQDGNFYGVTAFGGGKGSCTDDQSRPSGCGTIFELSPQGSESVLYRFSGEQDGGNPSSLIQGQDGKIYGTTLIGGPVPATQCADISGNPIPCCLDHTMTVNPLPAIGCGTIFEFDPSEVNLSQTPPITLNTLYTFTGALDGGSPGTLILGSTASAPSIIFGTTLTCTDCRYNAYTTNPTTGAVTATAIGGSVFSFVPAGSSTITPNTIGSFPTSLIADLAFPNSLVQWDANTLYGTTQMGGQTSATQNAAACLPTSEFPLGCGGVFRLELSPSSLLDLCNFGDTTCGDALLTEVSRLAQPADISGKSVPETIVHQSGQRFPTGGNPWGFSPIPIALAMDASGNIYGTTPPGCADASYTPPYLPDSNCATVDPNSSEVQSTVFKLTPSAETVSSPGSMNILYTFSGNGPTPSPTTDGAGSVAGLTLATDGNFYGLSGDGASASELFMLQTQAGSIPKYVVSLAPSYSPNWMIQGSDGSFYGTSSTYFSSGADQYGSVFKVTPSPSLSPPVQLCLTASPITPGSCSQADAITQIAQGEQVTLNWAVANAYSLTTQQCYGFVESGGASSAGTWSGLQKGSLANDVYGSSVSITPTVPGTYRYALTCGGTVSSSASLQVTVAPSFTLSPSPTSLSVPQGGSGTSTITVTPAGGFSGTVSLAASGLPSGVAASFAAGSAAGTQLLTLTASTLAAVTSNSVTITITGTSGTLTTTTSVALSITAQPSFTAGSGGTTSMTVTPGSTTGNSGTISVVGTNGFSGTVDLTCAATTSMTSVNDMPTCSLNPTSVTVSGTTAQTSTLTVTTTAASSAKNDMQKQLWPPVGGAALALMVIFIVPRRRRNWLGMLGLFLVLVCAGATGCGGGGGGNGGGGGGGSPGTTAGTYTITVTGTSGTVSATVGTITLTVQ